MAHTFLAEKSLLIVKNEGVSFGVKIGLFFNLFLFLLYFLASFFSENNGLFLILLGAGSNLIDRLFFGYVRDYWFLPVLGVYNNLNDWLITIGILIFIIKLWKTK